MSTLAVPVKIASKPKPATNTPAPVPAPTPTSVPDAKANDERKSEPAPAVDAPAKKKRKHAAPLMAADAFAAMDGGARDPPLVRADGIRAAMGPDEKRKVKRDFLAFVQQVLNGTTRDLLKDASAYSHQRRMTPKMLSASIATSARLRESWNADDCDPADPLSAAAAAGKANEKEEGDDEVKEEDVEALIGDDEDGADEGPSAGAIAEKLRGNVSGLLKQISEAALDIGTRYTKLYKEHLTSQKIARDALVAEHKGELGSVGKPLSNDLSAAERQKETLRRAQAVAKHMRGKKLGKFTSKRAATLLGLRVDLANVVILVRSLAEDASRAFCAAVAGALDSLLGTLCAAATRSSIVRVKTAKKPEDGGRKAKRPKAGGEAKRPDGDGGEPCGLISYEHFVTGLIRRKRVHLEKAQTVYLDGHRCRRKVKIEYEVTDADLLRLVAQFMPFERHVLTAMASCKSVADAFAAIDRAALI